MKKWNKTIMTVMMEFDYGKPERGPSGEKTWFYENLCKLVDNVHPFWFDSYLDKKDSLQKAIIEFAEKVKPDLIYFTPYTDQFSIETLSYLKSKFTTVAWFGDDQWRFDSYTKIYSPHFTHVITTDPYAITKYKKLNISPIVSEWAAQPAGQYASPEKVDKYDYEVSFIGGKNEVRSWFIKQLAKRGIKVECFGAGWDNGRISFEKMNEIFLKSKINLNLSNSVPQDLSYVLSHPMNFLRWLISKKNVEQVKARNFEIPLAGGFQISKYALGLERHLSIGEEIAIFNSPDECATQIDYFLSNDQERQEMCLKANARVWKEHTYEKRLEKILNGIFK